MSEQELLEGVRLLDRLVEWADRIHHPDLVKRFRLMQQDLYRMVDGFPRMGSAENKGKSTSKVKG